MKQVYLKIKENVPIAKATYKMVLEGDTSALTQPGQFVNFKLDGFFLRRPISVCDWNDESLTVIYKVVGGGTEAMSLMKPGYTIDTLIGLGNGFDCGKSGDRPVLIGGGVGVPPLFRLCRDLLAQGKEPSVILGFNSADEVFLAEEFSALGAKVYITTADGSVGTHGFVTDILPDIDYTFFYTCGPEPMFRAIERIAKGGGEYSFEERMGCGFGACMGCSCKTLTDNKRICKEGPVMEREEIIWEN